MINPNKIFESCIENSVDFFTGVPDSLLKNFCAYVTDHCGANHVIAANEGGAVGLAAGHYLATGKPALVYMQNSGQGNTVNPLASLADPDVYSIPMVLLVGWRGEPVGRTSDKSDTLTNVRAGEALAKPSEKSEVKAKDEPQHIKQGKITLSLYETLGIPISVLPDEEDEALEMLRGAIEQAKRESRPVALVVRKGLFAEYKLQNKKPDIAEAGRENVIERILDLLPTDCAVVSTTGMISREVYETRERRGEGHGRDFLTVGSMGHASMIALGIARAQSKRPVVCLDGDGASIMQMGNMAIVGQSGCGNLVHIVLNNAAHDSVGGQPTVGGAIDLSAIAAAMGYGVSTLDALNFNGDERPTFIEVRVKKGSRADLGRPKEKPQENKAVFMEFLRGRNRTTDKSDRFANAHPN